MNLTYDGQEIDPFRSRQVPDLGRRFREARDSSQRQANLMWLGAMVTMFSDHELQLLNDLGTLCPRDRDLLRQAGRPVTR